MITRIEVAKPSATNSGTLPVKPKVAFGHQVSVSKPAGFSAFGCGILALGRKIIDFPGLIFRTCKSASSYTSAALKGLSYGGTIGQGVGFVAGATFGGVTGTVTAGPLGGFAGASVGALYGYAVGNMLGQTVGAAVGIARKKSQEQKAIVEQLQQANRDLTAQLLGKGHSVDYVTC
ncbi:MAG: hypothetical protein OXC07_07895 [Kistimonas sp.]|nr:hypothetical protein [Kistimonas sp.]